MEFISLNPNVSVRKSEIIAVERTNTFGCRVLLENTSYDSDFPYETILQLLELPGIEEKVATQMALPEAYQRPMQYWAG